MVWTVKLVAQGLNMSRAGHADPGFAKAKNITIHHDSARDTIKCDTRGLDRFTFYLSSRVALTHIQKQNET